MKILGIETSCDDTAISVSEADDNKIKVLSNSISSQVKLHAKYGGVFPSLAAREHEKNLPKVLKLSLKEAKTKIEDINLIVVTKGPGLEPSLWRGVNFANNLAKHCKKPIIGVNHLEGHIYSNWLKPVGEISNLKFLISKKNFPILNLVVSGGHTELVLMNGSGKYKLVGVTLDDAVGEAFDKVARMLGLGYPGGPAIARRAEQWNSQFLISNFQTNSKSKIPKIKFPRPMINSKDFNFSFSGLKTAVLYKVKEIGRLTPKIINQICYEFQEAATDVLVSKTAKAAEKYKVKLVTLSGGVSANKELRHRLVSAIQPLYPSSPFSLIPDFAYTTDNAAMIALAGYIQIKNARRKTKSWRPIRVDANLNLG